jgi:ADP-ribosylation factor GTPase-activating protein 1
MDALTDKQQEMLMQGGNKNFKEFMEFYELNSQPAKIKYRTKAAEFYRQRV